MSKSVTPTPPTITSGASAADVQARALTLALDRARGSGEPDPLKRRLLMLCHLGRLIVGSLGPKAVAEMLANLRREAAASGDLKARMLVAAIAAMGPGMLEWGLQRVESQVARTSPRMLRVSVNCLMQTLSAASNADLADGEAMLAIVAAMAQMKRENTTTDAEQH